MSTLRNYLYDKEEHLFYRDHRYFAKREANGKKVFWGRGNGWVLGGLVEILQALPKDEFLTHVLSGLICGIGHPCSQPAEC